MVEENSWQKAYDVVNSMIDTSQLKQIDYDTMSSREPKITVITEWQVFWIKYRINFYSQWHPCAYINLPKTSELIDILQKEWYDWIPFQTCHWWITFWQYVSEWDTRLPEWRWIGWDYWHAWDYADYMKDMSWASELHKRTTEEILIDIVEQIMVFREKSYLV